MSEHDTNIALLKIAVAWVGATFGGITLSGIALVLTIIFTGLQTYVLVRDKIWNPPKKDNQ